MAAPLRSAFEHIAGVAMRTSNTRMFSHERASGYWPMVLIDAGRCAGRNAVERPSDSRRADGSVIIGSAVTQVSHHQAQRHFRVARL
jgi:hypothetical protein